MDKISQKIMDELGEEWRRDFVEFATAVQFKKKINGSKITDFWWKSYWLCCSMGDLNGRRTRDALENNKVTAWISLGALELDACHKFNGRKMIG